MLKKQILLVFLVCIPIYTRDFCHSIESGDNYYFVWPHNISFFDDGSFLLRDKKQLMFFDKKGNFVRNLLKLGAGPGEVQSSFYYTINKKSQTVYIYDIFREKLLEKKRDGYLLKEEKISLECEGFLCSDIKGNILILKELPLNGYIKKNSKIDVLYRVKVLNSKRNLKIKVKHFYKSKYDFFALSSLNMAVVKDKLIINSESDYKIQIYNINDFNKVLLVQEPKRKKNVSYGNNQKINFLLAGDILLVSLNGKKKIIFDEFNLEGQYLSTFEIDKKYYPLSVKNGLIYLIENDSETLDIKLKICDYQKFKSSCLFL